MTRKIPVILLSTAFALTACQNNNAAGNNMAAVDELNTVDTNMAAVGTTTAAATIDSDFLTDAIKGDNSEIAMGQLAQQMGTSQGVKDFGKTLATDHSAAKDQAAVLAQQAGLTVPTEMKDEAKAGIEKLKGLSGDAFDKAFVQMMIEDHKKDIAKFEKESEGNGQTAALAMETLPTLQKHLEIAQSLAK